MDTSTAVATGTGATPGTSGGTPMYGDSWRDVRASEAFNPAVDAVAVGQAAGAITTVIGAGDVVRELAQGLRATLLGMTRGVNPSRL